MAFRFEGLRVWQDALDYHDAAYALASALPPEERFNLADQLRRASTGIALNIAEGSTSQSVNEQLRFLGYSVRSLIECIACHRLIDRRGYGIDLELLQTAESRAILLFKRLQAFRRALRERIAAHGS
ncbi:MAG: four helix bundle protein [Candidatus Longimicrobiales bacterium M2_2A_002]